MMGGDEGHNTILNAHSSILHTTSSPSHTSHHLLPLPYLETGDSELGDELYELRVVI